MKKMSLQFRTSVPAPIQFAGWSDPLLHWEQVSHWARSDSHLEGDGKV